MDDAKEHTEWNSTGHSGSQKQERKIGKRDMWPLSHFTRYKAIILDELDLKEFLKNRYPTLLVNFESGKIKGDEDAIKNAIGDFESSINMELIKFTAMPGIQRLFFDEDGFVQEQVVLSIKNILSKNRIRKYSFQCFRDVHKDDTLTAMVYCLSREEAEKAKTVIENHIHSFTILDYSSDVKKIISKWKMYHKLVETECQSGGPIITCTHDVKQEIQNEEKKIIMKSIPMSPLRMKYLMKYGDIIESASKSYNVKIGLNPGKCTIELEGLSSKIKTAMNNIKTKMFTDTLSIRSNLSKTLVAELDSITDEQSCSWEIIKDADNHLVHDIQDCENIVTWYDPTKPGTFTIIEGESFDINVDCFIVLCTDNLYPVQFNPDGDILERARNQIEKTDRIYQIGEMIETESDKKRYSKEIYIVVGKSNSENKNDNKTFHGLSTCLKEVFTRIKKGQQLSVCLPAYIQEEFLSTDTVIKAYLDAAITSQKAGDSLKMYLYCEKGKGMLNDTLIDTINRIYGKELGFSRKVYREGLEVKDWRDLPDLQVQVEIESIEKMMTEIIVNTTSPQLDLSKGTVSNKLLKLAGREMQDYCNKQYPNGIDFTTVAVTDSYGLRKVNNKLNYVFHGALQGFRRKTYIQAVKTFIRCCLSEADKGRCKSIAFPALGTGKLGYPARQVAKAMFDAVDEYRLEAVCPCVQRVVFSLYKGDVDICQVFGLEEQDRVKDRWNERTPFRTNHPQSSFSGVRHLKGTIEGYMHPVEIIAGIGTSKQIPKTCIEIKTFHAEDSYMKFKYRNENPQSSNDGIIVSGGYKKASLQPLSSVSAVEHEDERAYKKAIKDAIEYCLNNNIAEVSFDICEGPKSIGVGKLLMMIATTVEKCLPTQTLTQFGLFVLHTVYVNLKDEEQYTSVEKMLKKGGVLQTVKNLLNSVNPIGSNVKWEVINSSPEDTTINIRIIGNTPESVQKTKQRIDEAVCSNQSTRGYTRTHEHGKETDVDARWFNENHGARPKTGELQSRSDSKGYTEEEISSRVFQKDVMHQQTNKEERDEISSRNCQEMEYIYKRTEANADDNLREEILDFEISAEINDGFILFKERYKDLKRWIRLVEKVYCVQIGEEQLHDESSVHKVSGNYQQIVQFKYYLDNMFPLHPKDISKDIQEKIISSGSIQDGRELQENENRKNEGIHPVEDYYCSDEMLILPVNETESILVGKRIEKKYSSDITRMKYDKEKGGMVIRYNGNKDEMARIKDEHNEFMRTLCESHIKLKDAAEVLKVKNLEACIQLDINNVCFRFEPDQCSIGIVGISREFVDAARLKIWRHLGRGMDDYQYSTDPSTENQYNHKVVDKAREGIQNKGEISKPHPPACNNSRLPISSDKKENLPNCHVSVSIYRCEIQDIKADILVVPYSRNPLKLSERVFMHLGDDVRRELNQSVSANRFQSCECRITSSGRLRHFKMIHMCLDEDKKSTKVTGKLLQRALTNALLLAKDSTTVAILLTGLSDDAQFNLVHAEQFFDSIHELSKKNQEGNISNIIITSHVDEHVKVAVRSFEGSASKFGVDFRENIFFFPVGDRLVTQIPEVEISSKVTQGTYVLRDQGIKILTDIGDVANVSTNGIVCIQDIDLSCSGDTAHKVYSLCGENYRKTIEESRNKNWGSVDILALPTEGGSITAQYVINVFLPEFKEGDHDPFTTKLHKIVVKILQKSEELKLTALAMPFLQPGEEDKLVEIGFIRACCKGMVMAIVQFFKDVGECCLQRLEILVKDEGILQELKREFRLHIQEETVV